MGSSWRLRLTLGYVALTAVLAIAWAGSLFGPVTGAIVHQQQDHLAIVGRAYTLALANTAQDPATFARRLAEKDLRVTIVAADGRVLGDSRNDPRTMENHASRPEIAAALAGRTGSDVRRSATEGIDQMYVAVPGTFAGQRIAMRVSESLSSVSALAGQARSVGLVLLAAALLVSVLVAVRLSSFAAAPVTRLAETARAIARGEARPVRREEGELGVVSDALADLAEQVRQRIAESEAEQTNLRTVLDGLDDAVLLLDGEEVGLANGATSRLFKPPFGGWRGRKLAATEMPASLVAAIREASETGHHSTRDIGPDPTGRTLRLTVTPISNGGQRLRTLVIVSDVTERARLDSVRRDFVANASHELKTPTSAIQLLAESAETAAGDGDTDQALAFVAQMRAEAVRLRQLVLDLLDLSRLEAPPSPGALTDIRQAVALAVTGHRSAAERKGLKLTSDMDAVRDDDVYAAVDTTDVAVALDNLISNAVSYTESGSVTVTVRATAAAVELTVTDTGVGIPTDELPRVFERFYRVDRARSRESGGTGLGLSLVKHVVERAGGEVWIASEPNAGTIVTLRLPRAV
jgi:two-component system, OmpR family, phosphate regulon sensor histidine kinase PhoR